MVSKSEVWRFRGFPRIRTDEDKEKAKPLRATLYSEVQRSSRDLLL
jgi:hypothetical protein